MPVTEAQLRHIARTEAEISILVSSTVNDEGVWWQLRIRLPDHPRDLCVVDANLGERSWRQLNALARFVIRTCGRDRMMVVELTGLRADMLLTKGESR